MLAVLSRVCSSPSDSHSRGRTVVALAVSALCHLPRGCAVWEGEGEGHLLSSLIDTAFSQITAAASATATTTATTTPTSTSTSTATVIASATAVAGDDSASHLLALLAHRLPAGGRLDCLLGRVLTLLDGGGGEGVGG